MTRLKLSIISILLLLLVVLCSNLKAQSLDTQWNNLDENQLYNIKDIYKIGKKYDYGFTLVAIAWQESQLGKYMINLSDPSFGLFHIVPRGSKWEKSREAQRLLDDFEYSIYKAINILDYWKKYHKGNWRKMIKSYNAGFNYNSKQANTYLKGIQSKVKYLKLLALNN